VATVANRIIEILPGGTIDRSMPYDDYLENPDIQQMREEFSRKK
jgi:hypothetical protein